MRILLITQGMSPIILPFFHSRHELVGIAEDGPRIPPSQIQRAIIKVFSSFYSVFYEKDQNLHQFCKKNELNYFYNENKKEQLFEEWVLASKPDLIVVYSMSHLLKETIFSIPPYGTINLHPSYLPKYRGPNPYIWMYYNMDLIAGVTVHYIDEGEDTGDIIFQEQIPVILGMPLKDLRYHIVDEAGVKLLLKAVNAIEKGIAPRDPQPLESPTPRARNLIQGEERNLIDWKSWDITRVWHMTKGYSGSLDFIGCIDRPRPFHSIIVEKYIECPVDPEDRGKIGINSDGSRYISCLNGKIIYRFHFYLPQRLNNLIKSIKQ